MNLLLYRDTELNQHARLILTDERAEHLLNVLRPKLGDSIKAGLINGPLMRARVEAIHSKSIELSLDTLPAEESQPPEALPLTLILALPRPKMLRRILQNIACMGVKELILINSYRVEKSYWQSPLLQDSAIEAELLKGLSQGMDTLLPSVQLQRLFKPFVEDQLPQLCQGKRSLLAHPYGAQPCPAAELHPSVLIVGPEGGFIPYEVDLLKQAGCQCIHIGRRILKVETAVPALLSRLFPLI